MEPEHEHEHFWRGKTPDELVPSVDPADLRAVWQLGQELKAHDDPGQQCVATGIDIFRQVCSPTADMRHVTYRMAMLGMLFRIAERRPEPVLLPLRAALAKWQQGIAEDRLFRVMAKIPLKWLPKGGQQGLPFDVEAFIKQVEQEAA